MMGRDEIRISGPELHRQNMVLVMLSQAFLGAITPNFRMIAINLTAQPWAIRVVLERDDLSDRDEIRDSGDDFESFLGGVVDNSAFDVQIIIDDQELLTPSYPWIPMYRRKEI